jgi:hypothetical protein
LIAHTPSFGTRTAPVLCSAVPPGVSRFSIMESTPMHELTIRLPAEQLERLKRLAQREERPVAFIARKAIEAGLAQTERAAA